LFPEIPDLKPPTVEQGVRSPQDGEDQPPAPDGADSPNANPADSDGENLEPPEIDLGTGGDPLSAAPMPLDRQITSLYLDPARTGGLEKDRKPGDEGIQLVFEPRNEDNDFVPIPGRVSAVLLDPETRERVARWEVDKEEVALALQRARTGEGIELAMPWKEEAPENSRLHLFVRYWLPDGKALQADREVTIAPHGQLASRWTPRTKDRPEPARADKPGDRESGGAAAGTSVPAKPDAAGAARQAQVPEWRPYR
jgi:hypothetical protein